MSQTSSLRFCAFTRKRPLEVKGRVEATRDVSIDPGRSVSFAPLGGV